MPTRVIIAYLLAVLLVVVGGSLLWRAVYFSDRAVRKRARRARREREKERSVQAEATVAAPADDS